jgi:iron complex transport system ATP-binding protein
MLSVESLAFGYADRRVGRDLSFSLAAGEVMCVLGPNGSGKTTLFRTLLGLLPAQGGKIALHSSDLSSLSRSEIARLTGYVPQAQLPYFAYTVREMVLMGRSAHLGAFASPGEKDFAVADRALEAVGIAQLAARAVTEISAGERQLALVARALAQEPRLLIMDEPTASLDFGNQVRVMQRISALAASGISILFSTHHPDQAFFCAHRAVLLLEGRILASGVPRDVVTSATLERMYGVPMRVVPVEGGGYACLPAIGRI